MKYSVTGFTNFCRVFQIPDSFPKGYCFGGGLPTEFKMVDWFNPVPELTQWAISEQKYNDLVSKGELEAEIPISIEADELQARLVNFLLKKIYMVEMKNYLVICNFGFAFMFTCYKKEK